MNQSLMEVASIATRYFAMVADQARLVVRSFSDSAYKIAEAEYLKSHKKLPGSDRTSRLRRKRRKAVLLYFRRMF